MNQELERILSEVEKAISGKRAVIEKILMAILSDGHILLDDVPGVGKTTLALALSRTLGLNYHRIQFTPDVLPSDIVGFSVYNKGTGAFYIYTPKGAYRYKIFAVNVVDPTDDAYQVGFTNTLAFAAFVKQLKANSMYDTGVDVAGYDHVVTLSTCSDTNRLVVCAKRVD